MTLGLVAVALGFTSTSMPSSPSAAAAPDVEVVVVEVNENDCLATLKRCLSSLSVVAVSQVLSFRILVTLGNLYRHQMSHLNRLSILDLIEILSAEWLVESENSAPEISHTGASFGSGTTKSGTRAEVLI